VVLLACAVVGLIFFFASTSKLREVISETTMDKVVALASDLETQRTAMAEISYIISASAYYKPYYLRYNSYNEMQMLQDFAKYRNKSQIAGDYFLMFNSSAWVYKVNNSKNTFPVFMDYYGLTGDPQALRRELEGVVSFQICHWQNASTQVLVFAWPVYTTGREDLGGRATIGFFVTYDTLKARVEALVGTLEGAVGFYCNGSPFMAIGAEAAPAPGDSGVKQLSYGAVRYTASSPDGMFQVVYDAPPISFALETFSKLNTWYSIIVVLVLFFLAATIGWSNYRPIRALTRKYRAQTPEGGASAPECRNELLKLEQVFDTILEKKETAESHLRTQYALLRKQILQLLLRGDTRYAALVQEGFMDIRLSGPLYGVLAVRPEKASPQFEEEAAALTAELSDEDTRIYLTESKYPGVYAVIVSAADQMTYADAVENITALLLEQYGCRAGASLEMAALTGLPEALAFAMSQSYEQMPEDLPALEDFDDATANRLLTAVKVGHLKEVELCIEKLFPNGAHSTAASPSVMERLQLNNLLYRVAQIARTKNLPVSPNQLSAVLKAPDYPEMRMQFKAIVHFVSTARGETAAEKNAGTNADKLVAYVDRHFAEPDLTLDRLAAQFKLSNRYISQLFKDATGQPFKNYLTMLRIARAQELLRTANLTVTEVSLRVGYSHLPHFIKMFKSITGYTPSNYANKS